MGLFDSYFADLSLPPSDEEDLAPDDAAPVIDRTKPGLFSSYIDDLTAKPELPPAQPRAFGSIGRGINRMEQAGALGLQQMGAISPETAAQSIANDEFDISRLPPSQAVIEGSKEIQDAEGWMGKTGAIVRNPSALLSTVGESLPASVPSVALGAAGSVAGPAGLAAGVGVGSGLTEMASTMFDTLRDAGIDTSDPKAIAAALQNPELMAKARSRGATRGAAVGAFDALSGGLAGRVIMPAARAAGRPLLGAAGELAMQAGAGSAGEAAAQVADQGKITDKGDVLMEAFGELVPGAAETALGDHAHGGHTPAAKPQPEMEQKAEQAIRAEQSGFAPKFADGFEPTDAQRGTAFDVLREMEKAVPGISDSVTFDPVMYGEGQAAVDSGGVAGKQEVAGSFDPATQMIRVSLADDLDPFDSGMHELFHSFQRRVGPDGQAKGVFNDMEQKVLDDTFKDGMTFAQMPDFVRNAMGEEAFNKRAENHVNPFSQREAQAVAFGAYYNARMKNKPVSGIKPGIRAAFEKIYQTIKKTGDFLRGRGITKAEQLFQRVGSGEIGQRTQTQTAVNENAGDENTDDVIDDAVDDGEVVAPREFAVQNRPDKSKFTDNAPEIADKPMIVNGKRDLGQVTAAQAYKLSQFARGKDAGKKFFGGPIRLNFGKATDWMKNERGESRWARGFGVEHAMGNHGPEIARAMGKSYGDLTPDDVARFVQKAASNFQDMRQGERGGLRVIYDAGPNVPQGVRYWTLGLSDFNDRKAGETSWQVNTAWAGEKPSGQPIGKAQEKALPSHAPGNPGTPSQSQNAAGETPVRQDAPDTAPTQNVQYPAQSQAQPKTRPTLTLKKPRIAEYRDSFDEREARPFKLAADTSRGSPANRRGAKILQERLRGEMNKREREQMRRDDIAPIHRDDIKEVSNFMDWIGREMFSDVGISISRGAGPMGSFNFANNMVTLFKRAINSGRIDETMIHELWHAAERVLSPKDLRDVRAAHQRAITQYLDQHPELRPFASTRNGVTNLDERVISDTRKAREYMEQHWNAPDNVDYDKQNWNVRLRNTKENYRFTNADEFFAETMLDKYQDMLDGYDLPAPNGIFEKVTDFAARVYGKIVEAVAHLFGRRHMERIFSNFENGRYDASHRNLIHQMGAVFESDRTPVAQPTAVDHGVGEPGNEATQWARVTHQTQAGPYSYIDAWGAPTYEAALERAQNDTPGAAVEPLTPFEARQQDAAADPVMYAVAPRNRGTQAQEDAIDHVQPVEDNRTFTRKVYDTVNGWVNMDKLAVKQGLLDQYAALEAHERAGNLGELRDARDSAYKAALNTQNLGSVMSVLLKRTGLSWNSAEGMVEPKAVTWLNPLTNQMEEIKGFQDIFADIAKSGNMRLWAGWAIANRAQRLMTEGRESRLSQTQINDLLALEQTHPEFRTALSKWTALNKSVLDFAQDAGVIDPAARAIWEKNDYVPFYRLTKDGELMGPKGKKGIANQRSGIKTLTGADEAVGDIYENMVLNMTTLVDASFKNVAMQRIVANLGTTNAMTKVAGSGAKMTAMNIPAPMAHKALQKLGVNIRNLSAAEQSAWLKVFTFLPNRQPDIVHVLQNGTPEYYQVHDPLLLRSIMSLNYPSVEGFMKLMRGAKRTLTNMVTLDPGFMLANAFRDTIGAALTVKGFVPGFKSLTGYAKAFREDPSMVALMASGAGGAGFYHTRPEEISSELKQLVHSKGKRGALNQMKHTAHTAMELWHRIGMASENMNRIAIYENMVKKGASKAEAAYEARDLMNFSMRGDFAAMRFLAETVPFMNARVQGLYKLYRSARDNRASMLLRGMLLTGATLALYGVNADDDRYKDLAEWDKDTNYHFWIGDSHFRLPKPFEVGAIFSTIPERLALLMSGTDSTKQTWGAAKRMFSDTFALNPTPQLFMPMIEEWANKESFYNRPIVGQGLQRLPNQLQYTPDTSAAAKAITGAMPEWVTGVPVVGDALTSPVRMEHLINGYFGTIGGYLLGASDSAVRAFGDGERAALRTDQIPVIKRFFRESPELSTKWATEFYEMKDETDKLYAAVSTLRKQGDLKGAMEIATDHRSKLAARAQLNSIDKALTGIRQQMQSIQTNTTMSSEAKRQRLDDLISRRNQISRRAEGVARSF